MNNKIDSLKFTYRISAFIIGFLIFSSLTIALLIYEKFEQHFQEIAINSMQNETQSILQAIDEYQNQALASAISFSKMQQIKQAFLLEDSAQSIVLLNNCAGPIIEDIKKNLGFSKYKVHFHKTNAQSFLRQWNQTGGDDLSYFRHSILHVQKNKQPLKCIELGRGGFAIRGIAPVLDGNDLLGSVEVFFEIQDVIEYMQSLYKNTDCVVLAKRKEMETLFFENEKEKYFKKKLGEYLIIENTLDNSENDNLTLIKREINKMSNHDSLSVANYENKVYCYFNISDFTGHTLGKIFLFHDNTQKLKETRRDIFAIISILIIAGAILIILIVSLVRRLIKSFENINSELRLNIAEKNKFFRIIAHDLKSPFSGLIGLSDILLSKKHLSEDEKNHIVSIMNEASREGLSLLNNLVEYTIAQTSENSLTINNLDIRAISERVISLHRGILQSKEIQIVNNIQESTYIMANKNSVETILRNLLSNAIKFSHRRGEITFSSIKEKNYLKISVSDTGIGMDENKIKNIFRTDIKTSTLGTEKEKGTGLGLPLIKTLVERNKGTFEISSKLKAGTVFSFSLPIAK